MWTTIGTSWLNTEKRMDLLEEIKWHYWYFISTDWNIYSNKRFWNRLKKLSPYTSNWYLCINLEKYGSTTRKKMYVHRLVAQTFLWDIEWKVVHHKDTDRANNNVINLEITTQSKNMKYKFEIYKSHVKKDHIKEEFLHLYK